MKKTDWDVLILGCGPAGFYAALGCAARGYRTAVIEPDEPGGTGFRWGALPVKGGLDLVRNSAAGRSPGQTGQELIPSFKKTMARVKEAGFQVLARLEKAGVTFIPGEPEILSPGLVSVSGANGAVQRESTRYIVIATGTSPAFPPGFEREKGALSHRELLFLPEIPKSISILGGNVEGIELACLYAGLGSRVTVAEQEAEILPGNDPDLIAPVKHELAKMGVRILTGRRMDNLDELIREGNGLPVITGLRKPNIPRGFDSLGGTVTAQGIPVGSRLETSLSGVFAAGDVNGIMGMAHAAIHQGIHMYQGLEGRGINTDYSLLPRAIFTIPEIAGAGRQENEIPRDEPGWHTFKVPLEETWRGFIRREPGFIKLIFDPRDILRGIWGTGPNVSEMLSAWGILLSRSIRRSEILDTLFIHPALGEAVLEGALKGEKNEAAPHSLR